MNIFEILSAGNRVLKEEHISAVLGWMLDPYHDHGLGMELLKRICHASFGNEADINKVLSAGEFSGLVMRDRGRLQIHTEMEVTVNTGPGDEAETVSGNDRSIDILVKINEKIVLAIENKTSPGSIQETQLKEEVDGFDATFNKSKDHKLYFLFLTPAGVGPTADRAMKLIDRTKCADDAEPVHILWKSEDKEGQKIRPSISQILNEILRDESIGKTSPLSSETKFLMKSFIRFIENDFSYIQGKLQRGEKYFIDSFVGIDAVRALFKTHKQNVDGPLYIGFMGGLSSFEASLKDAVNSVEGQMQLENRRFKTANDKSLSGKNRSNWFLIQDFVNLLDKYPFTKFSS